MPEFHLKYDHIHEPWAGMMEPCNDRRPECKRELRRIKKNARAASEQAGKGEAEPSKMLLKCANMMLKMETAYRLAVKAQDCVERGPADPILTEATILLSEIRYWLDLSGKEPPPPKPVPSVPPSKEKS